MLLRIQDRCRRLIVDKTDNRLELPDEVAVHLDAVEGETIFAVRIFERLELWSTKYREARLAEPIEFLEDIS
jgi:cupin superfamily acireductone dioxygenase involved in methionine salvage